MIGWGPGTGTGTACRRRGRPLRMLGLLLGGWVALRLVMLCLAVPAGADIAPPWHTGRASMLAVRPAGGDGAQGRYPAHGRARRGTGARPAAAHEENLLTVSARMADFQNRHPAARTWHAGLLALLDEDRMTRLRN
ncbi:MULTISPECIES: hypothetical protein [unclassified Sphingomonas]|uniref:hypothetical protein n=1 Tax=Novosphingobium rhizosphaerae TaxID=1551649 RepID=UPI0015CE2424